MFKEENYILVLGSKPDSKLPDIKVEHIYSANGAAERAAEYKKKYPWYPAMINVDLPNSDLNYFTEKTFSTLKYY